MTVGLTPHATSTLLYLHDPLISVILTIEYEVIGDRRSQCSIITSKNQTQIRVSKYLIPRRVLYFFPSEYRASRNLSIQ